MFFYDWTYLLIIPGLLLGIWAQMKVKSAYAEYSRIPTRLGMNAAYVVDQLLRNSFALEKNTPELRKGLNVKTLGSIEALIRENPEGPHTCESISAESGLSKVTVRHYLNYLIETGTLRSSIDYETGGRPRVLYQLK